MEQLDWVAGQRVQVYFGDGEDEGQIKIALAEESHPGTYALSPYHKVEQGKSVKCTVNLTPDRVLLTSIFPANVKRIHPKFSLDLRSSENDG